MAFAMALPWHEGEEMMHRLMKSPSDHDNPTVPGLSMQAANMLRIAPLLAVGTLDDQDRPWSTIWGGSQGFAQPMGGSLIGIRTPVDASYDPVVDALFKNAPTAVTNKESPARPIMVGGLAIDLETRKRVKVYGRFAAGAVTMAPDQESMEHKQKEVQLVIRIDQSLGNCPKYLNGKHISAYPVESELASESTSLGAEAQDLVSQCDLFFISSSHSKEDMDTNHRGGPPGFVRVSTPPDSAPTQLIWPEYSGNRLYQTLGNLYCTPRAGLAIPNFMTGDVLYVTGSTEILVGADAAALIPRSNLAVRLTITAARFVRSGLPFRGAPGEQSPYNPKVRLLASEAVLLSKSAAEQEQKGTTASLVDSIQLTPDVYRLRFQLDRPARWSAGQWVALDLSRSLDQGYSHMRDEDPTSLNDDWVRTFTVSSPPPAASGPGGTEFEITMRAVGPATKFLARRNLRAGLDVPVKGFGGEFCIEQSCPESQPVEQQAELVPFVAGGVGITPLLAALPLLDAGNVVLLWSIRAADLPLVTDVLAKHVQVAQRMRLFVTTRANDMEEHLEGLARLGIAVNHRRMQKDDVASIDAQRWYLCAGTALRQMVVSWFDGTGREVVFEDFNF